MNIEFDKKHIWHPFTQMAHHRSGALPLVPIRRARGVYLYTDEDQPILDGISSWWTSNIGHCHPRVVRAIEQQAKTLDHVMFAGFTHEPAISLSQKLMELTPQKLSHVFYSDDGSTAVECALKIASQYWHNAGVPTKKKFLTLSGAYHGDTVGAMSLGNAPLFHDVFRHLQFETLTLSLPLSTPPLAGDETQEIRFIEKFKDLIHTHARELAAVCVEPLVLGAAGMQMYSVDVLKQIVQIAQDEHVLVIFDEVMTGFGRTGKMFALNYLPNEIVPDIVCLSKGISGGTLALGATLVSEHIEHLFCESTFSHARTFFHGHSYTANPIACAASSAAISVLSEERLIEHCATLQPTFEKWRAHFARSKLPLHKPRYMGGIFACDITPNHKNPEPFSYVIFKSALRKGALIRPIGVCVYLMPPLCITENELNKLFSVLDECLVEYFT